MGRRRGRAWCKTFIAAQTVRSRRTSAWWGEAWLSRLSYPAWDASCSRCRRSSSRPSPRAFSRIELCPLSIELPLKYSKRTRCPVCITKGGTPMSYHPRATQSVSAAIERLEVRRLFSDIYEPNNSLGTATNFGTLGDREETGTMDISPSGDQDFYKFTALGSDNVFIRISFLGFFTDLDLYLYGPSNNVVADSTNSASNTEEI